jgi:hypothetical protein
MYNILIGFPRTPWPSQRYLPAARSAGLVTGSAGVTCMGLLHESEAARGPRGYSSGICLRLDLLVLSRDLRGLPTWGFYRDQRQPTGPVDMQRYLPAAGSAGLVSRDVRGYLCWVLQGSEAARGSCGDSSGICLRLNLLVVFTGSAGATCMGLLQGSEAARGSCGDSTGICLRRGLLVVFTGSAGATCCKSSSNMCVNALGWAQLSDIIVHQTVFNI